MSKQTKLLKQFSEEADAAMQHKAETGDWEPFFLALGNGLSFFYEFRKNTACLKLLNEMMAEFLQFLLNGDFYISWVSDLDMPEIVPFAQEETTHVISSLTAGGFIFSTKEHADAFHGRYALELKHISAAEEDTNSQGFREQLLEQLFYHGASYLILNPVDQDGSGHYIPLPDLIPESVRNSYRPYISYIPLMAIIKQMNLPSRNEGEPCIFNPFVPNLINVLVRNNPQFFVPVNTRSQNPMQMSIHDKRYVLAFARAHDAAEYLETVGKKRGVDVKPMSFMDLVLLCADHSVCFEPQDVQWILPKNAQMLLVGNYPDGLTTSGN